jgi:hypothetical protein
LTKINEHTLQDYFSLPFCSEVHFVQGKAPAFALNATFHVWIT